MTATQPSIQAAFGRPAVTPRRRAVSRWRRVQGFGGFVLACTFFLPAVKSCGSIVVPYEEVRDMVMSRSTPVLDYLAGFVLYSAAYLFGLLILIVALHRRHPEARSAQACGAIAGGIVGASAVSMLVAPILDQGLSLLATLSPSDIIWCVVYILSSVYWLRCVRRGPSGVMCMRWFGALCCTAWFLPWALGGAYYGLYLSLAGALLILIGAFKEAQLRTFQDAPAALRTLLTASLKLPDERADLCDECGYALLGLSAPRCPECGTPFDPNRLHNTGNAVD